VPSRSFELLLVATRPVLVVEQDELTVAHACGAPGVGDEHEREQSMRFSSSGDELDKGTAHRDAPIAICAL
jgi:hypothetical protein